MANGSDGTSIVISTEHECKHLYNDISNEWKQAQILLNVDQFRSLEFNMSTGNMTDRLAIKDIHGELAC